MMWQPNRMTQRKMNVLKDCLLPLTETGVLLALIHSEGRMIPPPWRLRPPRTKLKLMIMRMKKSVPSTDGLDNPDVSPVPIREIRAIRGRTDPRRQGQD